MGNQLSFDLFAGTGLSPVIRDEVIDQANYQGSFDSYRDADVEAKGYVKDGKFDWYAIHQGDKHIGGWQSGLTGSRQRQQPNIQNIPIRTEVGRTIRKAFVGE